MRKPSKGGYSLWMGFVYVSNLIVGTGALTMPLAIAKAGLWISIPMLGNDLKELKRVKWGASSRWSYGPIPH